MPSLLLAPIAVGVFAGLAAAFAPVRLIAWIAAGSAAAAFVCYAIVFGGLDSQAAIRVPVWAVPSLEVAGGLALDGLSALFALLIAGLGLLIFIYAGAYLPQDQKSRRTQVCLVLFMTAMLGAVTADDVIILFIFWELTSLTSFFLIGHDHDNPGARKSALQALLITGGGGLALLAGLIMIAGAAGTTSISGILAARDAVLADETAAAAMLLVLAGCFTKSAQIPFHFWLANAMTAPTPVSAYLHSATMVKLGVFLVARFNPVYQHETLWMAALTLFGLATAATGAVLAFRESDLKRVLAHTTVTALGTLMLLIGAPDELGVLAAMTFLIVHALYKAALFMVVGIVDHETGIRDVRKLGGLGRSMPITAAIAGLAALSMAGLPPFVGFVAKEMVYEAKLVAGGFAPILVGIGFLVNAATVAIAAILSLRLFLGRAQALPLRPHDPPIPMLLGPALLALAGLVAGAFPGLLGATFVVPAASAILGNGVDASLKLWHGFNLVLALSAATIATGIVLYLRWERLFIRLGSIRLIDRFGAAVIYERAMNGLVTWSKRTTQIVQHGNLNGYLRSLFFVTAVAILATLGLRSGFRLPNFDVATLDARALLVPLMAFGAVMTAVTPNVLLAVLTSGLVSFSAALFFLLFGAPDVAFTQFAVETLLVVLLAIALARIPLQSANTHTRRARAVDLAIASATGVATSALLLAVLETPFDPRLSDWFGAESAASAHGRNVVNVILVDFRALDTLGEITVLAIAAFAVAALLRRIPGMVRA